MSAKIGQVPCALVVPLGRIVSEILDLNDNTTPIADTEINNPIK